MLPGELIDRNAPMIASVASVAFRTSLSNQRSRIGRAAPVSSSPPAADRRQIAECPVESPELFAVAEPLAHADMAPLIGQRQRVGCRLAEHRLEHRGHPLQKRVVARILDGIFHAELGDLAVAERGRPPSSGCGRRATA